MEETKGSGPATRDDLARLGTKILGRLDRFGGGLGRLEKNADSLEKNVDRIEKKVDGVESRLDAKIDRVALAVGRLEVKMNLRFSRLEDIIRQSFSGLISKVESSLAQHKDQLRTNAIFEQRLGKHDARISALEGSRPSA